MRKAVRLQLIVLLAAGCTRAASVSGGTLPADPPAPWSKGTLSAQNVAAVYPAAWKAAENRATCRLIAPAALGAGDGATARVATFGGGWAVAYDEGGVRSAFGVAGTGVKAADSTYRDWPHTRRWSDGSNAGYGPEGGGVGPNQLAYLRIAGQGCLYNVWSRLGITHLEYLLEQLRFVEIQ